MALIVPDSEIGSSGARADDAADGVSLEPAGDDKPVHRGRYWTVKQKFLLATGASRMVRIQHLGCLAVALHLQISGVLAPRPLLNYQSRLEMLP